MVPLPQSETSGSIPLDRFRMTESLAREVLLRRFTTFGARIRLDHTFHEGEVLCRLDGYDPELRIGYAYISHADADVVTDIDPDAEIALHELGREGRCFVFVVHDTQANSPEQLVVVVDHFLHSLPTIEELRARATTP